MKTVCQFMLGLKPDHKGRRIEQIWALDSFWLEYDHEYIQWLFPIDTPSRFHSHSPIACQSTQDYFCACEVLREAQLHSLGMMLDFFGMRFFGNSIVPKEDLNMQEHPWLKPMDHNHLRITRIIRSLALLGQAELSQTFQMAMLKTAREQGDVNEDTLGFWRQANLIKEVVSE
ncbi:opioid growth factor receptor-related protein [Vibrio breoganii]